MVWRVAITTSSSTRLARLSPGDALQPKDAQGAVSPHTASAESIHVFAASKERAMREEQTTADRLTHIQTQSWQ